MKFVLILVALSVLTVTVQSKEVTCYIGTWGPEIVSRVEKRLCNYYLISFGAVNPDGSITPPSNIHSYLSLKTPESKLLLALGGGSAGIYAWREVSRTPAARANFALQCVLMCRQFDLDGVDIDWEFPEPEDRDIFTALHREIYELFEEFGLRLSTALAATNWLVNTQNIYNVPELSRYVHGLNLMTYDYHMDEPWDVEFGVNFNSPRNADVGDSIDRGVRLWLDRGAPSWKIFAGIPFYSRTYLLENPGRTDVGSPFVVGYQASDPNKNVAQYNVLCHKLFDDSWIKRWDNTAAAPFMHRNDEWISYENVDSVAEKARISFTHDLAGVMIWEIQQDDIDGACGSPQGLLRSINSALERADCTS